MSIFARKWTPRAHGGKADLFKNDQKMIENDQERIENDQEMIENDQKSHGALIMGPWGKVDKPPSVHIALNIRFQVILN